MECLGKHDWSSLTTSDLYGLKIDKPNDTIYALVKKNWDSIAKPIDSMGHFETMTARIGAITGTDVIEISKKAVIIMCADNGIVEEGISQSGQEVTAVVAKEMADKSSSVCKMAEWIGADTIVVDIGINKAEPIPGVLQKKVRRGTANFKKEPAMTEEEAVRAIFTGIELVETCKNAGYHIIAAGEMGIGNTTTSSAIAASLLQCEAKEVTGRGAGLSDSGLASKQQIITAVIKKYDLYNADALTILKTVGGLDIAGLVGVCIGGALFHIPIVLDGVISMVAALLAERMLPGVREYLLPSHKGKEPAVTLLMKELKLEPVIDGNMALGEGTGAVMMFALFEMALSVYCNRTTFSDIQIEQYTRF